MLGTFRKDTEGKCTVLHFKSTCVVIPHTSKTGSAFTLQTCLGSVCDITWIRTNVISSDPDKEIALKKK